MHNGSIKGSCAFLASVMRLVVLFICVLSFKFSLADIQRTCGLAEIGQAEDLCVHCMQASLLFGKIDQWVSQHCYLSFRSHVE